MTPRHPHPVRLVAVGLVILAIAGCTGEPRESPDDAPPADAPGRSVAWRYSLFVELGPVRSQAWFEYAWTARTRRADDGSLEVAATVDRVATEMVGPRGQHAALDTGADPSHEGELPPALAVLPELVGAEFTYRVAPDGSVSLTGWEEAVDGAIERAGSAVQPSRAYSGPVPRAGTFAEALERIHHAATPAADREAGEWSARFDLTPAGTEVDLETIDAFRVEGPDETEVLSSDGERSVRGRRIPFEGEVAAAPSIAGRPGGELETEPRTGVVVLDEEEPRVLLYRERTRFRQAPPAPGNAGAARRPWITWESEYRVLDDRDDG